MYILVTTKNGMQVEVRTRFPNPTLDLRTDALALERVTAMLAGADGVAEVRLCPDG